MMQSVQPPRGLLKVLYNKKNRYKDYSIFFATDTKRFYMKIGDDLVAVTPTIEEMNHISIDFPVCKNCHMRFPSTSLKTSVHKCPSCGFINDLYFDKKLEIGISKEDASIYIREKLASYGYKCMDASFMPMNEDILEESYIDKDCWIFNFDESCYTDPTKPTYGRKPKDPIIITDSYIKEDSLIKRFYCARYEAKFDSNISFIIVALIKPINTRKKPENRRIEIGGLYYYYRKELFMNNNLDIIYDKAIRSIVSKIEEIKKEYEITN